METQKMTVIINIQSLENTVYKTDTFKHTFYELNKMNLEELRLLQDSLIDVYNSYLKRKEEIEKMGTNLHVLKCKFNGATDTSGEFVTVNSERFKQRIYIPYDYQFNDSEELAINKLIEMGFNILGRSSGNGCFYIISDTLKPIREV
jgi:hypothetical protein